MAAADILYSAYGVSVSYREPRKKVKGSPIVSSRCERVERDSGGWWKREVADGNPAPSFIGVTCVATGGARAGMACPSAFMNTSPPPDERRTMMHSCMKSLSSYLEH